MDAHKAKAEPLDPSGWNPGLAKAFSNELRFRILMALGEREASPKELAEGLGADLRRVDEQIKHLEGSGLVELVDTDVRNGGTQHFYRALARPFLNAAEWGRLPPAVKESITHAVAQTVVDNMREAIESGDFDANPNRALLQMPLIVDEQGYKDADASALQHLGRLKEIAAESAARLVVNGEPGILVKSATIIHNAARNREG